MAAEGGYRRRVGGGVGVGEERFYCPPAMRRRYRQQQQHRNDHNRGKSKGVASVESQKMIDPDDAPTTSFSCDGLTNLDRFLRHTTPSVVAQQFPKTSMRGWISNDSELYSYFILADLWESFREWSAYGAGVPLVLNGRDSVIQYYVPYLSGIQLYIDPSKPFVGKKTTIDESDAHSSRETSSEGSSEGLVDGGVNSMSAAVQGLNGLSVRITNHLMGLSADESDIRNPPGLLIFEYLEREAPYGREPLADKISALASRFPEIRTLRSSDLMPASWISVAWYPIYRIPVGPTLKNLDACFLTYHSLSTPLTTGSNDGHHLRFSSICRETHNSGCLSTKLQLPTFGLASYKFKVSDWNSNGANECQKVNSLLQAADNWLQLRQVNHPDYTFFISRNLYWR